MFINIIKKKKNINNEYKDALGKFMTNFSLLSRLRPLQFFEYKDYYPLCQRIANETIYIYRIYIDTLKLSKHIVSFFSDV